MPKAQQDQELQQRARDFVDGYNGNVLLSAQSLEVQYHFLRRFLKTGRASEANRQTLLAALDAQPSPMIPGSAILRKIVQNRGTLGLTRAVLNDLLAAVDALEAGRATDKEQVNS
jgi:hypothetical protein